MLRKACEWCDRLLKVAAVGALFVVGTPGVLDLAGAIEGKFFPVRVNQQIANVTRTEKNLCFDWVSDKVRDMHAYNVDVLLEDASGETSAIAVYSRETGKPWRKGHAPGVGHRVQGYCVDLPDWTKAEDFPVRLHQRLYYHGALGPLWTVTLDIPDIVSPPGATM